MSVSLSKKVSKNMNKDIKEENKEQRRAALRSYDVRALTPFLLEIGCIIVMISFVLITYRIGRSLVTFQMDNYSRETDLSGTQIRPGLNIDTLPIVKLDFGNYRPVVDGGDNNDQSDIAERRVRCLQRGVYLGPSDEYIDCSVYCRVGSESEVKYTFVDQPSRFIAGRIQIEPGAWCMPTAAANCNPNSANVVYSLNGWLCIPRTDLLVGEGGNRIAVCNGSLYDNAMNVRYDEFIPSNLVFNNLYDDRLADGRFRFTCLPHIRDELYNKYLESPLNRFHVIHNYCVSDIPFAIDTAVPDFQTGLCTCPDPYTRANNDNGKCTACKTGFDDLSLTFNLRIQPCFSLRDHVQFINDLRNQASIGEIIRPCGLTDTKQSSGEVTRPRCIINKVPSYTRYLPSPNTMNYIRSHLVEEG